MNPEDTIKALLDLLALVLRCIESGQGKEAWAWYATFTSAWVYFRSELPTPFLGLSRDDVELQLIIVQRRLRQMEREYVEAMEKGEQCATPTSAIG